MRAFSDTWISCGTSVGYLCCLLIFLCLYHAETNTFGLCFDLVLITTFSSDPYDLFLVRCQCWPSYYCRYWDTRQPNPAHVQQLPDRCYALAVNYPLMIVGTADRNIVIFNLQNPQVILLPNWLCMCSFYFQFFWWWCSCFYCHGLIFWTDWLNFISGVILDWV